MENTTGIIGQKQVTLQLGYYQACKLIHLLQADIDETAELLGNETHMVAMDALNPAIRSNNIYSIKCADDLKKQIETLRETI